MVIWIIFLLICSVILYRISKTSAPHRRKLLEYLLIIVVVYFSAFRDGLGADYYRYILRTEYINNGEELLNDVLTNIVYLTNLSPIFYFLITSLLVYPIIIKKFLKQKYYILIILSFLISPGLGLLQSYNAIRQYIGVAFFFWALDYLPNRKYFFYFGLLLFASMFHASALLLIPFIFFLDKRVPKIIVLLGIVFSIVGAQLFEPIGSFFMRNTEYSDYAETSRSSSLMFILLSIIFSYIYLYNKDFSPKMNIVMNGGFFCLFFFNLSVVSLAYSRFSLYFVPLLIISLFQIIEITKKRISGYIILVFFLLFFIVYLTSSDMLPQQMLPLGSIFDNVYNSININYIID